MKTGILLLNFGGPDTNDEVVPFLYNLFSDPNVLVGIPAPVRQILAYLISRIKGPSSRRSYALIGGGSPQLRWTRLQVDGLRHALKKTGRDVPVSVGMRVWRPPIRQTLDELRAAGIEHLILLPLFPQYSTTTSKTCLEEVETQLKKMDWRPKRTTITSWPDFPPYIALLRRTVDEAVAEASRHPEPVHVLFSAHSLPMKIIQRGDPYPEEVNKTVQAVSKGLRAPWSLAFQSRNGRLPWLQPYTENEIDRLAAEGCRNLVIVPISFVSDHIETLYEIDMLFADHAKNAGITHYSRSRSFNDDPEFAEVLKALAEPAL